MSNKLECEIQIFDQFEHDQQSQETQKLLEFVKQNIQAAWAAMMKKQRVKSYLPIEDGGRVVWLVEVVRLCTAAVCKRLSVCIRRRAMKLLTPS